MKRSKFVQKPIWLKCDCKRDRLWIWFPFKEKKYLFSFLPLSSASQHTTFPEFGQKGELNTWFSLHPSKIILTILFLDFYINYFKHATTTNHHHQHDRVESSVHSERKIILSNSSTVPNVTPHPRLYIQSNWRC